MKHRTARNWCIALAIAASLLSTDAASAQEASSLNISATGYATRVTNRAWVNFNVGVEAKTPSEAIDAIAVPVKELLDRLAAKGITGANVRTSALQLGPKYEVKRVDGREVRGELLGYVAAKVVLATIEDVSQVKSLIREFPLVGPTHIADIGFFSTEFEAAQSEALVDAIQRARNAANQAVDAAGRKLGPVTSVQLSVSPDSLKPSFAATRNYSARSEDAYGPRLSVEPDERQLEQSVQLQWALR